MTNNPPPPMPPQWAPVWDLFERMHWNQAASTLRDRRAEVRNLALRLALPENGSIQSPDEVTKRQLAVYMAHAEDTRKGSGPVVLYTGLRGWKGTIAGHVD
jgi:hypothetical protein